MIEDTKQDIIRALRLLSRFGIATTVSLRPDIAQHLAREGLAMRLPVFDGPVQPADYWELTWAGQSVIQHINKLTLTKTYRP